MKYQPIDLSGVKTYPQSERKNKVVMDRDRAGEVRSGMSVADLLTAMPPQLERELREFRTRIQGTPYLILLPLWPWLSVL